MEISLKINQFKNIIKKISKLVIIKLVANSKFLDSAIKYSKGIGYQGSLKSEVDFLIDDEKYVIHAASKANLFDLNEKQTELCKNI